MIVEFATPAAQELDDAISYFNSQKLGLGAEFAAEVAAAVRLVSEYPHGWHPMRAGVRRCQLRRFEYALIYRVRGDVAVIYAVMHMKRRPGYWRKRLKT